MNRNRHLGGRWADKNVQPHMPKAKATKANKRGWKLTKMFKKGKIA